MADDPRRGPGGQLQLDLVRDPGPGSRTNTIGHPVERMLNASARDILDALENGFRARADLKGKLAELFMSRHLDALQRNGGILSYKWFDQDGQPDFAVEMPDGRQVIVETKNVRNDAPLRAETQKTRASKSDPMSRFYRADQFEVVAACLYNSTGQWEYAFARTRDLRRMVGHPDHLATIQRIDPAILPPWTRSFLDAT